jgi:nitrate reductase NapE component
MVEKKIVSPIERKKNVTLFMIIVFSILLVATSGISNFLVRMLFQIILFIGQLLIVKTLLDDFYQE